jgi:hypothetical protein
MLTLGELLSGRQVAYPHQTGGNVTYRRATRELKLADQSEIDYGAAD